MRLLKRLALMTATLVAFGAIEALATTLNGGPVPLSVRTIEGRVHGTSIMWKGDKRQLVVINVTEDVGAAQVGDLFRTLSMQLARATAIDLRPSGGSAGCCATMTGSGVGFAGNVRANLRIEQKLDGAGRVVQMVVIRGYGGPPMDGSTARMLFQ
ncbi:MAG: hypothetical protein AB7O88_21430 [Reyranellaceae bacterium]